MSCMKKGTYGHAKPAKGRRTGRKHVDTGSHEYKQSTYADRMASRPLSALNYRPDFGRPANVTQE